MINNKAIILVTAVILCLICGLLFFTQSAPLFDKQKFEVSNLSLAYGHKTLLGMPLQMSYEPVLSLTIRNLHSSSLTHMGLTIDGVNYGRSTVKIPPGQVYEESISLPDIILSSSKTYKIELTSTFADGSYQTHVQSYTTPQFKGQAQITEVSLELKTHLSYFHIEIKNTGNLPTTRASCSLGGREGMVLLTSQSAMPGEIIKGGFNGLSSHLFEIGSAYSVNVQLTYMGGSTSTVRTSVVAQS